MAEQSERGYQDHRYYNSNGSYRIVYTAGSAAPRFDEQPSAPAKKPQSRQQSAPAKKPQSRQQSAPAKKPQSRQQSAPAKKPQSRQSEASARGTQTGSARPASGSGYVQVQRASSRQPEYSYKTVAPAGQTRNRKRTAEPVKHTKSRTAYAAQAQTAHRNASVYAPLKAPQSEPLRRQPVVRELTKEEQNAKTRREHIARRNAKRESYMNRSLATFLIGMAAVVCGCCGAYVHMTAKVQATESRISDLNTQIEELRAENDAYESAVYSGLDLETIRTQAEELGMVSLEDAKIRYFTMEETYFTDTVTLTE